MTVAVFRDTYNINKFFLRHLEFIQYIEAGKTYLDEYYFTRCNIDYLISKNQELEIFDPNFNTPKDRLLGKVMAFKRLMSYLHSRKKSFNSGADKCGKNLKWTSTKASLTELIYALYSARVINNGNATLKEITTSLQKTFNFEIGDIYRIFSEIRSRKREKAKFINELEFSILRSMENLDG